MVSLMVIVSPRLTRAGTSTRTSAMAANFAGSLLLAGGSPNWAAAGAAARTSANRAGRDARGMDHQKSSPRVATRGLRAVGGDVVCPARYGIRAGRGGAYITSRRGPS